ncbi:MAG: dephospho-CoA kinase [Deltaproteobacteria bacterium]|nr:MAG: dephospho-CoA kinase [Deltaproteobacteria bacterium]
MTQKRIALTGGIATGKSTVAGFMAEAGAQIIDADIIAHELMQPGKPAWRAIVAHFGTHVLLPDQRLDRQTLGDIIFNDPDEKAVLDAITHPLVFQTMDTQHAEIQAVHPDAVIIHDIPLLVETGRVETFDAVILVYIPMEVQLQRLMARNGFSQAEAIARVRSQMPIDEKKHHATHVIDNQGDLETTRKKTGAVLAALKQEGRHRTAR